MNKLTVYTKDGCGYCVMLKTLLEKKGFEYEEVNISENHDARTMLKAQGHKTVPQIYQNGELFVEGGYRGMYDYINGTQTNTKVIT